MTKDSRFVVRAQVSCRPAEGRHGFRFCQDHPLIVTDGQFFFHHSQSLRKFAAVAKCGIQHPDRHSGSSMVAEVSHHRQRLARQPLPLLRPAHIGRKQAQHHQRQGQRPAIAPFSKEVSRLFQPLFGLSQVPQIADRPSLEKVSQRHSPTVARGAKTSQAVLGQPVGSADIRIYDPLCQNKQGKRG